MEYRNGHPSERQWDNLMEYEMISSEVIETRRVLQAAKLYRELSALGAAPDETIPTGISGHPDFVWWNRASVNTTPLQQFAAGLAVFVQYNLSHRIRTTLQRQGWSVMVIKPSAIDGAVRRITNRLDGLEIASMGDKHRDKIQTGEK